MTIWTVPARVVRVIDGDTIVADLDQGWSTWRVNQRIRLLGCDCPEMNTPAGKEAKRFVEICLTDDNGDWLPITVTSHSLDSFGRVLGSVRWPFAGGIVDLTDHLISNGRAVPR